MPEESTALEITLLLYIKNLSFISGLHCLSFVHIKVWTNKNIYTSLVYVRGMGVESDPDRLKRAL